MKTMQILTLLLATIALGACQPDADINTEQGTITVNEITVQVQQLSSMGSNNDAGTRALGTTTGMEKKEFVEGDVLHIVVTIAGATAQDDPTMKYYAATYTDGTATPTGTGTGTGTGTWTLNDPMLLPQGGKEYSIMAFYGDVLNNEKYTDAEEFMTDWETAGNGTPPTTGGLTTYADLLMASGIDEGNGWQATGITITPTGTLTLTMAHAQSLLCISSITNNLGGDVTGIVANLKKSDGRDITVPLTLTTSTTTPPVVKAEAIAANNSNLKSFTVTLDVGNGKTSTVTVLAPDKNGTGGTGSPGDGTTLNEGKSYTYHLSLNPGSLTAIPTDGMDSGLDWGDKGDPNVPAGYTPIYNRAELEAIDDNAENLAKSYILMADIDLTPGKPLTPADPANPTGTNGNWAPIGNNNSPFLGTFNGNGHIITGMTISGSTDYQGLFGYIGSTAILYNIHLRDVNVTGKGQIGALVGQAESGTISGCSSTGKVSGASGVGGLVGYNSGTHITRCWSSAEVKGTGNNIGGLVGTNGGTGGTIVACYTQESSVSSSSSSSYLGGLVGNNAASIFGCYAAQATVTGSSVIGALVGYNSNAVTSCYATNASGSRANPLVYTSGSSNFTACISPLPRDEVAGTITNREDYSKLTPSVDATANGVRTIIPTTGTPEEIAAGKLGAITTETRPWKTTGIWGDLTGGTVPLTLAPTIKWDYNGDIIIP